MLARSLYDFQTLLRRKGILFCYSGYVTEAVLTGVGEALRRKMAIDEADTKTVRSVFAVFVEQMQNIMRYSAEKVPPGVSDDGTSPIEIRYGVIAIGQTGGGFFVEAGNLVSRTDVERLSAWLDKIRTSDRAALRTLYKEQIKEAKEQAGRGPGLGFIEIARRASQPIEFDFTEVDDRFAFFTVKAVI